MQGIHGMWELAVNKGDHDDIQDMCLVGIVQHLGSSDSRVRLAGPCPNAELRQHPLFLHPWLALQQL